MDLHQQTQPIAVVPAIPAGTSANGAVHVPEAAKASLAQAIAKHLRRNQLVPYPDQPRRSFPEDALRILAEDMRSHGQLTPLVVNPSDQPDLFFIEDGHRRWAAAPFVPMDTLLCVVVQRGLSDTGRFEAQLLTSIQRQALTLSEEALAYARLINDKGCTAKRLAAELHVSETMISNSRNILDVARDLWPHIDDGTLTQDQVRKLARLKDDPEAQIAKAQEFMAGRKNGKTPRPKADQAACLKCQLGKVRVILQAEGLSVEQADAVLTELGRDLKKLRGKPLSVVQQFFTTKAIADEANAAVQELGRPVS
jgi:ParB/RepB/Spo0J family partition protein